MPRLQSQVFTLDRREFGQRLQVTAKRYTLTGRYGKGRQPHQESVTLILAHNAGLHKEQWEPFLEDLQILQADSGDHTQPIVNEAWSIDCPNHGEGAIVNEDDLFLNSASVGCVEYARSILCLLESGLLTNSGSPRSVIFGGHGAGATTAVLAAHLLLERSTARPLPYRIHSLLLLDPLVIKTPSINARTLGPTSKNVGSGSALFVDPAAENCWPSETDALRWLSCREPWKSWDARCLTLFGEYGLRPLPTTRYPDALGCGGVTLTCPPGDKKFVSENTAEHAVASEIMSSLSHRLPVHVVFGEDSPFCPSSLELGFLSDGVGEPTFSSIRTFKAGHMVLQEHPTIMARHLLGSLRDSSQRTRTSPSSVEVQARL